jgi:hypothetical protein
MTKPSEIYLRAAERIDDESKWRDAVVSDFRNHASHIKTLWFWLGISLGLNFTALLFFVILYVTQKPGGV